MQHTTVILIFIAAFAVISWGLWLWRTRRIALMELLILVCCVMATLGSLNLLDLYTLLKPLPMATAMVFVVTRAHSAGKVQRDDLLLLAALLFSLCGDVFLMLPGDYFIPGLASFLVAHCFYIVLFRQGQTWLPSKAALACVLGAGLIMYAIVWPGLGDTVLRIAVATYVLVISLMTAQAIGRATILRSNAARWVAIGACIFMCSDSMIAISKFINPIALESLWVLATYFAAQMLIVHFSRERTNQTVAPGS